MHDKVSKPTRKELVMALRRRYHRVSKGEKQRILDEFVTITGYHRKHAIRLLSEKPKQEATLGFIPQRVYGEAVRQAVVVLWEAADRICGKRLRAILPTLIEAMERHGHLKLHSGVRTKLLQVSAATLDRMLRATREKAGTRRRKPRSRRKLSKVLPIKTFNDWQEPLPGFLEIDFVVHGGGSMAGEYLHSLVATDVCTGWTEAVPLLVREQSLVIEGLKKIQEQLPMPMRGIDSDNDGAFINDTLSLFCDREKIAFTRSRPHQKNDQAWIEQKNGAVIRRMVGYDRLSGIVAGQVLAQLYQAVRLYVNFFQPSFKLRERSRRGGKMLKRYHLPATPCERVLERPEVPEKAKRLLRKKRNRLDPVKLLHRIRQGQSALATLIRGESSSIPNQQSLAQFLSSLPDLWQRGEVRPTHRRGGSRPHDWRTRDDPFEGVGGEILLWLQAKPDITGSSLFARLTEKYPGRFTDGQLRTLQRRVAVWRRAMAMKLVFEGQEEPEGDATLIEG